MAVLRASLNPIVAVGRYVVLRYRQRARMGGTYVVARQLRKQGIPLVVARLILFGRL